MIKLYGFSRVNQGARGNTRDLRVLWALEEMGLEYEVIGMDHPNHDLDSAHYRALNPFGQIPLIDDDGIVVSESGAIVLYLARKSGKLVPADRAGEAQVLRWCFTALTTIELPVLSLWFVNSSGGKHSQPSEALEGWANMRLEQLDGWLANRHYIASDDFTVADILMTHVLDAGTPSEMLEHYPNLVRYRAACTARAAWRKTMTAYLERVVPA
jgi:glutathione S-transferase